MEIIKFTVKETHLKQEGDKNGRHWTKTQLIAEDDREWWTWNHEQYEVGGTYERGFKENVYNGKTTYMLDDNIRKSGGSGGSSSELKAQMDLLTDRVKKLEDIVLSG